MLKIVKPVVAKALDRILNYTHANIHAKMQLNALEETVKYVEEHMLSARGFAKKVQLLKFALSQAKPEGIFMEFGVWQGSTINFIAQNVNKTVHGFDSFEGLPEFWLDSSIGRYDKGSFHMHGKLPKVQTNVQLHVGWFDKTLPEFVAINKEEYVSFIHIDCDLYSSTKTIFDCLGERIKSGTIIVFDEYFNYPSWQKHEFKAFQEFIAQSQHKYEYIGYDKVGTEVAVKIL